MDCSVEKSIRRGLKVDIPKLEETLSTFDSRIEVAEMELKQVLKKGFSVKANSSKSCKDYFEKAHGLRIRRTDKIAMQALTSRGYKEPGKIVAVRSLIKERSTLKSAMEMAIKGDGVISIDPGSRGISGRRFPTPGILTFPQSFRDCVVPEEGHVFISADYRSQELMVIAVASGEYEFVNEIRSGKDPFMSLQSDLGISKGAAKAVIYGRMYGQTDEGTAYSNDLPLKDVIKVRTEFDIRYPRMYRFILNRKAKIVKSGKATTLVCGEVYRMKRISDMEEELRRAVNFEVQGSGADIMELLLNSEDLGSLESRGISVKFPVFDALLFQVDSRFVVQAQEDIKKIMESIPAEYGFTQVVKLRTGKTWKEVTE